MGIKAKLTANGLSPAEANIIVGTITGQLTATGNSQSTALLMSLDDVQYVTTVSASTGVIFNPGTGTGLTHYSAGDEVSIINHGGHTLSVYPATGGAIANGGTNAAYSVPSNKTAFFLSLDGLNWAASVSN